MTTSLTSKRATTTTTKLEPGGGGVEAPSPHTPCVLASYRDYSKDDIYDERELEDDVYRSLTTPAIMVD